MGKDRHTKEQRSYNMSRIRSTNTMLELMFFTLLDEANIKYEKHPKLYGKPDCLIHTDILIFVDSDFWHGWHFNQWRERMPQVYWIDKIERNMQRDKKKFRKLRKEGYIVLRVWEHSLKKNPAKVIEKINLLLSSDRQSTA
jgi:DNA mismatch endonuclease (patch repair protein)